MSSLLPPNATALELALETVLRRRFNYSVDLSVVNSIEHCPANFLPWLAWSRSVDTWDNAWTDAQKRAVIAASFTVHQKKGTVGAVKTAVNALGYRTKISEWWQHSGAPYTFKITVYIKDRALDLSAQQSMRAVVDAAKNARSAYTIALASESIAQLRIATAVLTARRVRVEPWRMTEASTTSKTQIASAIVQHRRVRVNPQ